MSNNNPTRVLFVSHELSPYVETTDMSKIARRLPLAMQDKGMEIRLLMPRFGVINERRHRLHEVVRLSGINILIGDSDNPLLIKVASLPGTRMQVYFLDNEEFFQRKALFHNNREDMFDDNHQRMIFFCKGVMETVTKLGWAPDIIHCQGWFTSLIPMYVKRLYNQSPIFKNTRVVYSAYEQEEGENLPANFAELARYDHMTEADLAPFMPGTPLSLEKGAAYYADGIIQGGATLAPELTDYLATLEGKDTLGYHPEAEVVEPYYEFYKSLLSPQAVLA